MNKRFSLMALLTLFPITICSCTFNSNKSSSRKNGGKVAQVQVKHGNEISLDEWKQIVNSIVYEEKYQSATCTENVTERYNGKTYKETAKEKFIFENGEWYRCANFEDEEDYKSPYPGILAKNYFGGIDNLGQILNLLSFEEYVQINFTRNDISLKFFDDLSFNLKVDREYQYLEDINDYIYHGAIEKDSIDFDIGYNSEGYLLYASFYETISLKQTEQAISLGYIDLSGWKKETAKFTYR